MTDRERAPRGAVILVLLLVQLVFASWAIVGKVTLGVVSPEVLTALRLTGGALAFGALGAARGKPLVPPRGERRAMLRLALTGLVINQLFFTWGLARTTAVETALLVATIPVFSAAYAVMVGVERPERRFWLGLLCALSGAVLVARPWRIGASPHFVGDVLVLINSASYASYLVHGRASFAKHGAFTVLGWMFPLAALCVLPLSIAELLRAAPHFSARTWGAIAYVVLGPTVFAYAGNAYALARAPSSLVAAFIYIQPALAVLLAMGVGVPLARWLGVPAPQERFDASTATGLFAILSGVWVATRAPSQHRRERKSSASSKVRRT